MRFVSFPGGTEVDRGLRDLTAGKPSNEALLVMIGAPRLRALGLPIPIAGPTNPEAALYERLAATGADSAHSRYNALIRLLVSFERALESGAR